MARSANLRAREESGEYGRISRWREYHWSLIEKSQKSRRTLNSSFNSGVKDQKLSIIGRVTPSSPPPPPLALALLSTQKILQNIQIRCVRGFLTGEKADFWTSEVRKYREVPRSTKKYEEVRGSTKKYVKFQKITEQKYAFSRSIYLWLAGSVPLEGLQNSEFKKSLT